MFAIRQIECINLVSLYIYNNNHTQHKEGYFAVDGNVSLGWLNMKSKIFRQLNGKKYRARIRKLVSNNCSSNTYLIDRLFPFFLICLVAYLFICLR